MPCWLFCVTLLLCLLYYLFIYSYVYVIHMYVYYMCTLTAGNGELVVMETSEDITDETILTQIQPASVLSWARARVALQLAESATSWATIFSYYHSGMCLYMCQSD